MPAGAATRAKEKTETAHRHLLTAIRYIPDDKLDWSPMGTAKTPAQIGAHCAAIYVWAAGAIRGEDKQAAYTEIEGGSYPGKERLIAFLDECFADLTSALDSVTDDQLDDKRQVFWGEDTVGGLLEVGEQQATWHTGQLNYIQTLLGDSEGHWE